ncbi:MAG TPA: penicillin-binding transpeptidase domain-containing protein, partial [Gammaproteobacteria bacterium]|nr:penicillin-binding transpeptidase domain-containing protein [Gammaproteobacteria bacterium]
GPNAPATVVARRGCELGPRMEYEVDCAALTRLVTDTLSAAPRIEPTITIAPHVARRLLRPGVSQARSTLDANLQRQAIGTLQRHLYQLADDNVRDGALLVVENRTGEVLAYVGNSDRNPDAFYVDGVIAPRQAGSTLKPFLYGMALEKRWLTAASLLADTPVNLETPTGMYVPQNYNREFRGWVSARSALAGSLNVPAVRTLMLVGVDAFIEKLRQFGFIGLTEDGDFYGYSLALGSGEVTLWQLVNAYRALANQGRAGAMSLEAGMESPSREILDPAAAFVIGDILADRGARGITFGLDNPLALPFPAAVKTGTSKDMRDNWCIGYSDRYTVGVWVGNFNGDPMHDVSGVSGAAPVWAELMRYLHRDLVHGTPALPEGVVARQVSFSPAIEPQRQEYFLRGTETSHIVLQEPAQTVPKIAYPADGGIIALDPDIPGDLQRIAFTMSPENDSATWRLDGQPLSLPDGRWQPRRGSHALVLQDAEGQVIDEVRFVVRGR